MTFGFRIAAFGLGAALVLAAPAAEAMPGIDAANAARNATQSAVQSAVRATRDDVARKTTGQDQINRKVRR
jgi:hypothetical protein